MSEPVVLDVSPEGVALVLLNRPGKRNAFNEEMIAALADAFETLRGADHVRAVFLRGAGGAFSAGADIEWMRRQGERLPVDNEADALALAEMLRRLHGLPQLTVALVDGPALGGACGLVAACDYAAATRAAHFRFTEARLGLTPATVAPYVIEAVGPRVARALFASAAPFDAEAALRFGLVHEIAADESGLDSVMKRLAGLAFENAPGAVADAKELVRDFAGKPIDQNLARESARRIAARRASVEGRAGLTAFLERRRPPWDQGTS